MYIYICSHCHTVETPRNASQVHLEFYPQYFFILLDGSSFAPREACMGGGEHMPRCMHISPCSSEPTHNKTFSPSWPAQSPQAAPFPKRNTQKQVCSNAYFQRRIHWWACQSSMTHPQRDISALAGSCRVLVAPVVWEMAEPGSNPRSLLSIVCEWFIFSMPQFPCL